jgi:chemotaxis family two-component system response regulator Rcp1
MIEVLLIEDNPGDVRLTQEVFRYVNPAIRLHVVRDGVQALSFLRREGTDADAARPDLILLDLDLPKMDGREVLAKVKEDCDLKSIPTVILTSSEESDDVARTYRLQASCYLHKPVQLDDFESLIKCINDFWLLKARLARQPIEA